MLVHSLPLFYNTLSRLHHTHVSQKDAGISKAWFCYIDFGLSGTTIHTDIYILGHLADACPEWLTVINSHWWRRLVPLTATFEEQRQKKITFIFHLLWMLQWLRLSCYGLRLRIFSQRRLNTLKKKINYLYCSWSRRNTVIGLQQPHLAESRRERKQAQLSHSKQTWWTESQHNVLFHFTEFNVYCHNLSNDASFC